MSELRPVHSIRLDAGADDIILTDEPGLDWHLATSPERPELRGRLVTLSLEAKPLPDCSTELYVNRFGGDDILQVTRDGVATGGIYAPAARLDRRPDGAIVVGLEYFSRAPTVLLGMSQNGRGRYEGSGMPQWRVAQVNAVPVHGRTLTYLDVGAAGGLSGLWEPYLPQLNVVLVEPFAPEAEKLRTAVRNLPSAQVIEAALSDRSGVAMLNITRFEQCSSLLEPNPTVLQDYHVAPCFDVVRRAEVRTARYDELPGAPQPDFVKIDVQGLEYEVLSGLGVMLDGVLGVEMEAHLYPIYRGQKLLHDLVALMARHGLKLNGLVPNNSFDRDFVEVNAYFTRARPAPADIWKVDMIRTILNLQEHDIGRSMGTYFRSASAAE